MTVEVRPLGVACNIKCHYCYQNPQREASNFGARYDLDAIKTAVEREGGAFTIFGGEALLIKKEDLEDLWSWGFNRFGRNGIQTNGTLIDDDHLRMMKMYNVYVGVSIDGPAELNDIRWAGSLEKTREATEKTLTAIERLTLRRIPTSVIITLHRGNATSRHLPLLIDWVKELDRIGVSSARLHLLEVESQSVRDAYALSERENIEALLAFSRLQVHLKDLNLDVFSDQKQMLLVNDNNTTCVWNACDPYTTRAVRGIEGFGQQSNCGRTNKDGIDFVKSERAGYERYIALYHTPQQAGGCMGCRFFLVCKGQCPGTAMDGDWRNRTEHCEIWKTLFRYVEKEIVADGACPLSLHPDRVALEEWMLNQWAKGNNEPMEVFWKKGQRSEVNIDGYIAPSSKADVCNDSGMTGGYTQSKIDVIASDRLS